jgi:hypothetical protein
MCMSCGCGEINEKHGNDAHITWDDVQAAARAADVTPDQVMSNMQEAMGTASAA